MSALRFFPLAKVENDLSSAAGSLWSKRGGPTGLGQEMILNEKILVTDGVCHNAEV